MKSRKFCINVPPVPWQRVRWTKNKSHCFDGQKRDKQFYAMFLESYNVDRYLFEGPIKIKVTFFLPCCLTLSNLNKSHTSKPDIDNLVKFLLDAISNKVLIKDDRQVVSIQARKVYDENPRTEFTITEVSDVC